GAGGVGGGVRRSTWKNGSSKWEKNVRHGPEGAEALAGYRGVSGFVRGFIRGAGIHRLHPRRLIGLVVVVGEMTRLDVPACWAAAELRRAVLAHGWVPKVPAFPRRLVVPMFLVMVVLFACCRRYQLTHPDFTVEYAVSSSSSALSALGLFLVRALTDLMNDICGAAVPGYCGGRLDGSGEEQHVGGDVVGVGVGSGHKTGEAVEAGDVNRFFFL
ncbi:unnamed protein product, partial [Discosporangium mesarthrocarpum]